MGAIVFILVYGVVFYALQFSVLAQKLGIRALLRPPHLAVKLVMIGMMFSSLTLLAYAACIYWRSEPVPFNSSANIAIDFAIFGAMVATACKYRLLATQKLREQH